MCKTKQELFKETLLDPTLKLLNELKEHVAEFDVNEDVFEIKPKVDLLIKKLENL